MRFFRWTLMGAALLACGESGVARPTLDALFPAQPSSYVTDLAGALSPTEQQALNHLAQGLRERAGVELTVVVLPTLKDYAPVDVATEIGRRWGVGQKGAIGSPERNNGLVLLIVPKTPANNNKGECFLATGNGVEGRVPDLTAHALCTEVIIPQFKRVHLAEYASGITAGVTTLVEWASHTRSAP